jgi:hypothetical protein
VPHTCAELFVVTRDGHGYPDIRKHPDILLSVRISEKGGGHYIEDKKIFTDLKESKF